MRWPYKNVSAGFDARFNSFASRSAELMGSPGAFAVATLTVVLWALVGPWFDYSDAWQLVINTATTVLTFLAVFLIQHSQNRDGRAIQLKLDELIRSSKGARNRLIDLESCSDEEMQKIKDDFARINAQDPGQEACKAEEGRS